LADRPSADAGLGEAFICIWGWQGKRKRKGVPGDILSFPNNFRCFPLRVQ
jgi:hypothetical protein